jgi:hypothetical protein
MDDERTRKAGTDGELRADEDDPHPIAKLHARRSETEESYGEERARMPRGYAVALVAGGLKAVALILVEIGIIVAGIVFLVRGEWVVALVLWLLLAPFVFAIADIVTGIVLSPLFLIAYLMGWRGED